MSKKKPAIENAAAIIEKFGGIRPMAKKLDVAVTTVQGWKKRGTIPGGRRAKILKVAGDNNVDLGGLISTTRTHTSLTAATTVATNDAPSPKAKQAKINNTTEHTTKDTPDNDENVEQLLKEISAEAELLAKEQDEAYARAMALEAQQNDESMPPPHDDEAAHDDNKGHKPLESFDEKLAELERSAITKSTWITIALLAGGLGAAALFLFSGGVPKPASLDTTESARISAIEQQVTTLQDEVSDVKDSQSFLKTIIPADLDARIEKLQTQTETAVSGVNAAIDRAENLSRGVMDASRDMVDAATTGDISTRINALEDKVKALRGSPEITAFMSRVSLMGNSFGGQAQIDQAMRDMRNMFTAAPQDMSDISDIGEMPMTDDANDENGAINDMLSRARTQSDALSATFENVPKDDLKAAALLLGMTQFRSTLKRDNVAFDDDLIVLQNLIGADNPELMASLNALAPHAQRGVLTPKGLGDELKSVSGDIIISSLKGEDVSIKEKLKARLNGIVKVEKDGALLSGTDTQAALLSAENMTQNGDIQGAIETLTPLKGKYGAMLSPWITKANATLNAQNVQGKIERSIQSLVRSGAGVDAPLYITQ